MSENTASKAELLAIWNGLSPARQIALCGTCNGLGMRAARGQTIRALLDMGLCWYGGPTPLGRAVYEAHQREAADHA